LLISSALSLVALGNVRELWLVYALAAMSAAGGTFDNPARSSFFPSLVPREHLPNAIGLNSILFQASSVTGPMVAGFVIAKLGVGWVYVVDNPYYAVTGPDGKFKITDVPPGEYKLVAVQHYTGPMEMPVKVTASQPTNLEIELKKQ
jgi:MFS family permease